MKTKRPLGVIRPLATMFGRARRRWRDGPLAPMIWRRRPRARTATPQKPVSPSSVAHHWALNLNLIWPAGTAARATPLRHVETTLPTLSRVGRDGRGGEPARLATLVERLWLRSGKDGPRATAGPGQVNARQVALRPVPSGKQDASGDMPPHLGRAASRAGASSRPFHEFEARSARLPRMAPPRVRKLRPMRADAIQHGSEPPPAQDRGSPATPGLRPARAPVLTAWRTAAARAGSPAAARTESPSAASPRPSRPRTALVWRNGTESGASPVASATPGYGRRPSADLVWRRPAAGTDRNEAGAPHRAPAASFQDSEIRAGRPAAPVPTTAAAAAPAAMQPAEMSRLVDEVVRRLDRIGRDERLRRGI
jgi:hypothetical protein